MKKVLILMMALLMIGSASAINQAELDDMNSHLVGYFDLEEPSLPFKDYNGIYNLTNGSFDSKVSGMIGEGVHFDKNNQDYVYTDNVSLNLISSMENVSYTVSYWVKFDSLLKNAIISTFESYPPVSTYWYGWWCYLNNQIVCESGSGLTGFQDSDRVKTNYTFQTDRWYHVVMVYNGTFTGDNIYIYVNGTSDVIHLLEQDDDNGTRFYSDTPLVVGAYRFNQAFYTSWTLNGTLDEIAMFNTNLNQDQIDYLFRNYEPTDYQQPPFGIGNYHSLVSISSPANHTQTNISTQTIQYTVTDDDNATLNCDLYINSVYNQSNGSVFNNTLSGFNIDFANGISIYEIRCSDLLYNSSSGIYDILIDTHKPQIMSLLPLFDNSTVYTNDTMTFIGNVTNINLTNVTRTIFYPNSTIYYYNETTLFMNSSFISWNQTFNTSSESNGVWTYTIYAKDSVSNEHTHYYSFEVNNCIPDWSCIVYGSCEVTDTAQCVNVTDNNMCGINYTGNYSEFTPQSCDYCSPSITESQSEDTCLSSFKYENVSLTLTNYEVCCNMTHLASDCVCINESTPLNDSQWYSEDFAMCDQDFSADNINSYSWYYVPGCVFEPEYTTDDITVSIIDSLGRFVVTIALMMGIVAMFIIFRIVIKNYKQR